MIAPSVNVFITFEAEEMLAFLQSKSLQTYSENLEEGKSLLFSNTPNSSLLSLDHSFRVEGKPELTIKFLDPEDHFLKLLTPSKEFFTDLTLKKSQLEARNNDAATFAEASLQNQIDLRQAMLDRSIFITYGIGDDIERDWCPPLMFSKAVEATYRMDSRRAKEISITYDGVGSYANLGVLGIDFLKKFSNSVIISGSSQRLFNEKAFEKVKEKYPDTTHSAINESLHYTIRTALHNFIKTATQSENVLVLLPDLDKYLFQFREKKRIESFYYESEPSTTFESVLQPLGFTLTRKDEKQKPILSFISIANEVAQKIPSEMYYKAYPKWGWLQTKDVRAVLKTNGLEETFLSKLNKITNLIKEKIIQYPIKEDVQENFFDAKIFVETNFKILNVLFEKGLIETNTKPAVLFTTDMLYHQIIGGGLLETNTENLDSDEKKESYLQEFLSYYDREDGIDYDYVKDVYNALNPPIPTIGPFVGLGNSEAIDDLILSEDANVDKNLLETIKSDQRSSTTRVPIFSFGTKNSNILSVNINVDPAVVTLVNSFRVVNNPTNIKTTLALVTSKNKDVYKELIEVLEASENTYALVIGDVPEKFIELVGVLYSNDSTHSFRGSDFSNSLKDLGFTDTQLNDLDIKAKENKDEFYISLWNAFNVSFREDDGSLMKIPQNLDSAIAKILRTSNIISDLGDQAISGGMIKTLPYFNLGTPSKVGQRKCLIFGKESNIFSEDYDKSTYSWYSGVYKMYGFRNYITKNEVFSEFSVAREPSNGGLITF